METAATQLNAWKRHHDVRGQLAAESPQSGLRGLCHSNELTVPQNKTLHAL